MIFKRLLIANRGEIALRIMRTAKQMHLTTLAIYEPEERGAMHVQGADEACEISRYLSIEAIIEAARHMRAEAVHPGYGFLSENADFAHACEKAGLIFVGPSPDSIKSMGDKAEAKHLMKAAGVPVIEGFSGSQDANILKNEALKIGYPVMIKAVAGGGGRGMRLVETHDNFQQSLIDAQFEAQNAFGDARVLLEKAIINPRHIEIQVMADRHGNVIHLGERDCSVQRRHQKLIEEAPSPAVSPELREKMGEVAVNAARAIGYLGAGTFEFLLDDKGAFTFMEMNTRLQVEHPVTEAITGLDLVELQLRIAMGEPLPLTQQEVQFKGHAIEVRFCAEDPYAHFLPQTGVMTSFEAGKNIRIETGIKTGSVISASYDSMIAKFISHAETREKAIDQLAESLLETKAFGVKTNQKFLLDALNHEVFKAGQATTSFIGEAKELLIKPTCSDALKLKAASIFYGDIKHSFPVLARIQHEDEVFEIALTRQNNGAKPHASDVLHLLHEAHCYTFEDISLKPKMQQNAVQHDGILKAVMTGKVVALLKNLGDRVEKGEPLITLEAMKMQHHHLAPNSGTITKLNATLGAQVSAKTILIEVEA
jgi:geranyl-CoA carboxylase alpha subunit